VAKTLRDLINRDSLSHAGLPKRHNKKSLGSVAQAFFGLRDL
jgi:hypothetical protein